MAIAVTQRGTPGSDNAAVGTVSSAFGSAVTVNNSLIAIALATAAHTTIGIPTDTVGNTYNLIFNNSSATQAIKVFQVNKTAAGSNTVTFNDSFNIACLFVYEVSGLATINSFDVALAGNQTSATPSVGPMSTNFANELILGIFSNNNGTGTALTVGAGYSNALTSTQNSLSALSEEQIVAVTGSYSAPAGSNTGGNTAELIISFADTPKPTTRIYVHPMRPHAFSPGIAR